MRTKIKKGDTVEVISGKFEDVGKRGEVIKVFVDKNRVSVQGVNIRVKHQRQVQKKGRNVNPGRIKFEGPVHISNVMLVCPKCNEPARVGVERDESGSHRVCKQCKALID